jgi:hypothetical protein
MGEGGVVMSLGVTGLIVSLRIYHFDCERLTVERTRCVDYMTLYALSVIWIFLEPYKVN